MAEYQIDELKIEVSADTKEAQKSLNALKRTLSKFADLAKQAKGINTELGNKLNKIAEAMNKFSLAASQPQLAAAIKNANAMSKLDFSALGGGLRTLDGGAVDRLGNLANALNTLSGAQDGIRSLRSLAGVDLTGFSLGLMDLPSDGIDKLERLAGALGKFGGVDIGNAKRAMRGLGQIPSLEQPQQTPITPEISTSINDDWMESAISQQMQHINDAASAANNAESATSQWAQAMREAAPAANSLNDAIEQMDAQRANQLSQALGNVKSEAAGATSAMKAAPVNKFTEAMKHLWQILRRPLASAATAPFKFITKALTAAARGAGMLAKRLLMLDHASRRSSHSFGGLRSALKTTLLYSAASAIISGITDAVKEGTKSLYEYSSALNGSLAGSLDSLATGFNYLRNSIGAAASPIIESIAPAIDYVIDKAVALFNVLNQVFSRLAGKSTWTQAVRVTTAFGEAASSAGGAAKEAGQAAKDMAMAFDELNVIDQDSGGGSSGGGGGGGGSGGGVAFQEVPIDNNIANWTDQIKDMIDNGQWAELGTLLGEKLNEVIDMVPWAEWGKKFGQGIQNALEFTYAFLTTVNWDKLGAGIATFLNEAMYAVDWDLAGRTLAAGANSLVGIVSGFVATLDWTAVGTAISDGINGAVDEFDWEALGSTINDTMSGVGDLLIAATDGIKWYEIGEKVGLALQEIDWQENLGKIGTAAGNYLQGLPQLLKGIAENTPWEDIGSGLATAVNNVDWSKSLAGMGSALGECLLGIGKLINAFLTETDWQDIGEGIAGLLENIPWSELADTFGDAAYNLVSGLVSSLVTFLTTDTDYDGIPGWVEAIAGIIDLIGALLAGALDGLLGGTAFRDWWNDFWGAFTDPMNMNPTTTLEQAAQNFADATGVTMDEALDIMKSDGTFYESVKAYADEMGISIAEAEDYFRQTLGESLEPPITDATADLKDPFASTMFNIGDNGMLELSNGINNQGEMVTSALEAAVVTNPLEAIGSTENLDISSDGTPNALYDLGEAMGGAVHDGVDTESPNITGLFTTLSSTILSTVAGIWAAMTIAIPLAWILIKAALNLATTTAASKVNTNMDKIGTHIAEIWSGVKSDAETAWSDIKNTLSEKSYEAADTLMSTMSQLSSNLSSVWSSMESAAQSAMSGISASVRATASAVSSAVRSMQSALNGVSSSVATVTASVKTVVSSVPQYATGGYPDEGELFVAREAGPELVGSIGRRTAVANNDQIIEGIREGVAQAMRETQGNSDGGTVEVKVYLDGKQITAAVEKRQRQRGATIYPGGVVSGV